MRLMETNYLTNQKYSTELLTNFAYNSSAIENNPLSLEEVKSFLVDGVITQNTRVTDFFEIYNHKNLWTSLERWADDKPDLSINIVREIHYRLMNSILSDAGSFKLTNNAISGANFQTTPAYQISYVVRDWVDNYSYRMSIAQSEEEKLRIILESHIKFERIHPFSDGNGRTGRTIMLFSCFKEGITPFVIPVSKKKEYLEFLQSENVDSYIEKVRFYQGAEVQRFLDTEYAEIF